jgi:hypothetical protein
LGGDRLGYRVFPQSDHHFRFWVNNNKVEHFVYGLKDCIWPDFVCHFSLFCGVHPNISGFRGFESHDHVSTHWRSTEENMVVSSRSPLHFKPWLDVLRENAFSSPESRAELLKFDLVSSQQFSTDKVIQDVSDHGSIRSMYAFKDNSVETDDKIMKFGLFPIISSCKVPQMEGVSFASAKFMISYYDRIKLDIFQQILDLKHAGYSDQEIVDTLKIKFVLPNDYIQKHLNLCDNCGCIGHQAHQCSLVNCSNCFRLGFTCWACK